MDSGFVCYQYQWTNSVSETTSSQEGRHTIQHYKSMSLISRACQWNNFLSKRLIKTQAYWKILIKPVQWGRRVIYSTSYVWSLSFKTQKEITRVNNTYSTTAIPTRSIVCIYVFNYLLEECRIVWTNITRIYRNLQYKILVTHGY